MKHPAAFEIHGILFDFDGTLAHLNIDFQEMREAVRRVGAAMGAPPAFLEKKYILEAIDDAATDLRKHSPELAEAFQQAAARVITEIETRAAAGSYLLPGVPRLFEQLRSRGIATGIVTRNCRQAVEAIMGGALSPDVLRTRDDVDKVKPHPAHLLLAAEDLRIHPQHVWMVGDHPMDMVAGNRAGMRCVGVLTGTSDANALMQGGAWKVIPQVTDLVDLLPH